MEIKNKLDEINKKMGKKDLNINPIADLQNFSDRPRQKIAQSCIFETQKINNTSSTLGGGGLMLDQLYSQKKSNQFGATGNTPTNNNNDQTSPFNNISANQTKKDTTSGTYAFQNITTINSAKNIQ